VYLYMSHQCSLNGRAVAERVSSEVDQK
jgi:hypothetical protein